MENVEEATATPINGPGKGKASEVQLSQKDYRPTPFATTRWEVVGERITNRDFLPLEVAILKGEAVVADPMFEVFAEGLSQDLETVTHSANPTQRAAESGPSAAPEISAEVLEELRQKAFEEGRAQGRIEGADELRSTVDERYNEIQQRLEAFHETLRAEVANYRVTSEKRAAELALAIAKKILVTTAEIRPQYILDVVRGALESEGAGKPLRIRVSPQDYEFLEVIGLPAELSTQETGVHYVSDENVASGCVLETDFGEVDLQLEKMWEQIKESLYEVVK